jgi:hypothetical protein
MVFGPTSCGPQATSATTCIDKNTQKVNMMMKTHSPLCKQCFFKKLQNWLHMHEESRRQCTLHTAHCTMHNAHPSRKMARGGTKGTAHCRWEAAHGARHTAHGTWHMVLTQKISVGESASMENFHRKSGSVRMAGSHYY